MPQLSCMHATKQVMYATGLHRSLGRVHMLQNRVMYATGLHRIRICMSLSSRVDIYATEQGCVRHGTPQNRDMCATEQGRVYHRAGSRMPQLSFVHATKQVTYATGLHRSLGRVHMLQNRVAYATGLYRIGICMSLSRVLYATV